MIGDSAKTDCFFFNVVYQSSKHEGGYRKASFLIGVEAGKCTCTLLNTAIL